MSEFDSILVHTVLFMIGFSMTNIVVESLMAKCTHNKTSFCRKFEIGYLRIAAKFKKGQVVALQSITSKVYFTIAFETQHNKMACIHYIGQLGELILLEDGRVEPVNGLHGYIKFWLPLDTNQRCFMVLQGAKNFEF